MSKQLESLRQRAEALHLYGVLAHWSEVVNTDWIENIVQWEEDGNTQRSLERRVKNAHIGRFKHLSDFDWTWPQRCDRGAIEALMSLDFMDETANVVLVGPNGIGKTMVAQNIAHQALVRGYTVLFISAGQLLGEMAALDSDSALRSRLNFYTRPQLLLIDEIGYLSYSNRYADLLFELVSRRYESKSTIFTTNKSFKEWSEVFLSAACVVSLVDRIIHHAEIIPIEGESYRLKEAQEHAALQAQKRKSKKPV